MSQTATRHVDVLLAKAEKKPKKKVNKSLDPKSRKFNARHYIGAQFINSDNPADREAARKMLEGK
jgi:hypothetical protein